MRIPFLRSNFSANIKQWEVFTYCAGVNAARVLQKREIIIEKIDVKKEKHHWGINCMCECLLVFRINTHCQLQVH